MIFRIKVFYLQFEFCFLKNYIFVTDVPKGAPINELCVT